MKFLLLLILVVTLAFAAAAQPVKINAGIAKKIADATPAALPQSPKDGRARTDAQDAGLKGKVMSVVTRTADVGDKRYPKKILREQEFYSEAGNRIRRVDWEDVYPTGVTVFGYIDGMRVSRYGSVVYAPGEKPELSCIPLVHTLPGTTESAPKGDDRYNMRWVHKYDALGRIAEEQHLGNGGQLLVRTVYKYEADNRRVLLHYAGGTEPLAKTLEIIDPATGNVIEEWLNDEDGNVNLIRLYSYEYDSRGNWIVQTITEKGPESGSKPKPSSTTQRTIEYYP